MIDVLNKFGIITNVITLNKNYLRTEQVEEMMFGAFLTRVGDSTALNLKANSDLVKHLLQIICNPSSLEEAFKINTALKCLCMKITKNTGRFYRLLSEALHRRMIFQKLSSVYAPLIEELKANKDFLIMLRNNNLIDMQQLQESDDQQATTIAQYIIHNINHYRLVKRFLNICQLFVRDTNFIEDLEEIIFDIEMIQCAKIEEKIKQDSHYVNCTISLYCYYSL